MAKKVLDKKVLSGRSHDEPSDPNGFSVLCDMLMSELPCTMTDLQQIQASLINSGYRCGYGKDDTPVVEVYCPACENNYVQIRQTQNESERYSITYVDESDESKWVYLKANTRQEVIDAVKKLLS